MEQKLIACGNRNYPWLVAQNPDGTGEQTFYTIPLDDQPCHFQSRIPKLLGRLIHGHSHGWVILSNVNKNMWSLWNPVTCKILDLPPLILNNSESVGQCCLSSPPDDPTSILFLTITGKPSFVFCRLGFEYRWTRRPYIRQLKGIIGHYHGFLQCLTSYYGKVYALSNHGDFVIQVDIIVVKDGDLSIQLLLFGRRPYTCIKRISTLISLLKGSSTELFYIVVTFTEDEDTKEETLSNVYLYKWVMTTMGWQKMANIKDAVFFVDLASDSSVYYNTVASELGGYIYIRDKIGKMMYSYDVEGKTISLSSMAYLTSHVPLWECRLESNHGLTLESEKEKDKDDNTSVMDDDVKLNNESRLLNLPLHLLEMIMDHCIGVEYMHFRATCKRCHLAAPLIQWSNKRKMHKYSLVSPWLVVVDTSEGILSFTDPLLGDKYFIERPLELIDHDKILCSRFGWLLLLHDYNSKMLFFNPFTGAIRKLPHVHHDQDSVCFSAPPTSPDCMVIGFTKGGGKDAYVHIYFVARQQTWRTIRLDFGGDATPSRFCFPTLYGHDIYVLCGKGEVYVFKNFFNSSGYCFKKVAAARSCQGDYFLVKRDQQILLVIVGKFGESNVEVFKLNDYTKEWKKLECLGRHMIYIGVTTCICIEAKTSEMENKIFFPRLHSSNGSIVFYSLETNRYHRFNNIEEEYVVAVGRKHVYPHVWIEPTWS